MSRGVTKQVLSAVAAVVMLMGLVAQIATAKGGTKPVVNTTMSLYNPAFIEGHELKAGDYGVVATETVVTISRDHKVIAEVPIQWKPETGKSQYSTFVTDGNKVTELHFSGKTQYAVVTAS